MSDQNTTPESGNDEDLNGATRPHGGRQGRRTRFAVLAAVLLGSGVLVGGLGTMAMNASAFGDRGHGWHGHGAEHMLERAQKKVSWLLAEVDATPEQSSEIQAIVQDTVQRVATFRDEKRSARKEFMAELLQSEINPDRLETLRQQRLASMDQMSSVMLEGAVKAAKVLSPEQREQIREEVLSRRHFRR